MDRAHLEQQLWPQGSGPRAPQAYALLDGARDARIVPLLRASRLPSTCLFEGALSPALAAAAPWLVQLAPESRFFTELIEQGWGRAWGVYLVARPEVTLQVLRRHFRTLLRVKDQQGRTLLFRFHDPRVLRLYLPACAPDEAARFFGPIQSMACESEHGDALLAYPGPHTPASMRAARGAGPCRISPRQMDAFAPLADALLVRRIVACARERDGAWTSTPDSVLLARVADALQRARHHGLTWDISLADYALLDLDYGAAFARHPAVAAALDRVTAAPQPDRAFFFIRSAVPQEVWNELAPPAPAPQPIEEGET
jgi:hypothetical protein